MLDLRTDETGLPSRRDALERALDLLPVPTYIKGQDGAILFVNRALMGGKPREFYIGKKNRDFVGPDEAEALDIDDERVLRGEPSLADRTVYWSNREFSYMLSKWSMKDTPYGDVLIGCVYDMSSQGKIRAELQKSEIRFRSIWEASREPMCLTDERGIILAVNPAFARMVAKPISVLDGSNVAMLFRPEQQAAIHSWIEGHFASRQGGAFSEIELNFADGRSGTFDISVTFIETPGQPMQLLSLFRDVTERQRTNRDLAEAVRVARDMAAKAEMSSAAKSQFLANMSHEIRTPLNGIMGMTGLALQTALEPDQREYLELVESSAESLLALVNDVLDFSKYDAGKLVLNRAEFSLRKVLREVLKPLALRASMSGVAFKYSVDGDIPDRLTGDYRRLSQVLMNLAGNAVKFTPAGRVEVRVCWETAQDASVVLRFSIADTGVGIPPEKHRLIFEPFTQVDESNTRRYGGTGLGLSIVAGLVELMGGRVWLESKPGEGSTFFFTAPFVVANPKRQAAMHILLTDENRMDQRVSTRLLEREGHCVQVAADARQAALLLDRNDFDLVLLDVQMPGLDSLMQRASGKHVPIIGLTAQASESERRRCRNAGLDAYVQKPIRVPELMSLIESVLPGDPDMDAELSNREYSVEEQLQQLDESIALTRVGGDAELLCEVIGLFLDDYPHSLEKIRTAVNAGDPSGVEQHAHSLKGSVSIFGAKEALEAAFSLEKQGRSGNLTEAPDGLKRLEQALASLKPELEAIQARR